MYVSLGDAKDGAINDYLSSLPPDEETQALARVLTGDGLSGGTGFVDFFLQQVQEGFQEVVQIDKVLGDNYVAFYFGQEPPVFQYSGTLLNSQQDDQRTGFARAYLSLLRGTQMARRGTLLRLRYDSVIVSGTLNSMSQSMNAENEMAVPFAFSLLVKEYLILPSIDYKRVSPAQYIQLATPFYEGNFDAVGLASDIRALNGAIEPTDMDDAPTGVVDPKVALVKKAEAAAAPKPEYSDPGQALKPEETKTFRQAKVAKTAAEKKAFRENYARTQGLSEENE
jgi:hypothetical protein